MNWGYLSSSSCLCQFSTNLSSLCITQFVQILCRRDKTVIIIFHDVLQILVGHKQIIDLSSELSNLAAADAYLRAS